MNKTVLGYRHGIVTWVVLPLVEFLDVKEAGLLSRAVPK
jgi:hypothetical protein